jgi:hypothetical protein
MIRRLERIAQTEVGVSRGNSFVDTIFGSLPGGVTKAPDVAAIGTGTTICAE